MTLVEELREQERAWEARPLLRRLYRGWFAELAAALAPVEGPTVELGSGIGKLREVIPELATTDVEPTPWADRVVDAEALPYADGQVANLVLVDVFHHLARPTRFFDEAVRVLAPGGRLLVLDPYCSTLSTLAFRWFHHERTDLDVDAFEDDVTVAETPMASNQARATLAFFREPGAVVDRWPALRVVRRKRLAHVLYPLSGGFSRRPLVPAVLYRPLAALDRALAPLGPLLAFRCLVVLERRYGTGRTSSSTE